MHLRQPGFTYIACVPFTKNKERTQKFKETGDSQYIYQFEWDKACFWHDMAYGDFKDLTRRPASYKISKFEWTIRIEKVISTPIWATKVFCFFRGFSSARC